MPDKSLSWVRDIEVEDLLDNDAKLVFEHCGLEVFVALWEALPSISIHVSSKPLNRLRQRYIKKHFNGSNVKELCLLLDCSERFFYDTLEQQANRVHANQEKLF
jgi:Mor family transcriptional regulator